MVMLLFSNISYILVFFVVYLQSRVPYYIGMSLNGLGDINIRHNIKHWIGLDWIESVTVSQFYCFVNSHQPQSSDKYQLKTL